MSGSLCIPVLEKVKLSMESIGKRIPGRTIQPHPASGSALVVILWLIAVLSVLVTTMAFDAHLESRIISYSRKRTKADHMVRSGLEIAEMLMRKSNDIASKKLERKEDDRWYDYASKLAEGLMINGLRETLPGGEVCLDIEPEPARRNVNLLKEEDWERVLEVAGVPMDSWAVIIESFEDWKDRDSDVRPDGAETDDYYSTLDKPYRAKNGPVDTVEELLLVKGFTRAVLSGGVLQSADGLDDNVEISGIIDLLTVYGDGKVNINAASGRVLRTLPGVDEVVAGAIIEEREGLLLPESERENTSFKNIEDLYRRIPELDPEIRGYITTGSQIFRVTSTATVGGVSRRVWCIGSFVNNHFEVLRWWEHD